MSNYLLEIGVEEMPAHLVAGAEDQLCERIKKFLNNHSLGFKKIIQYSTSRRLAVFVEGINSQTNSSIIENRGPSLKISQDSKGNWTKAAQGFAKSKGVNVEDLRKKNEYVYAVKYFKGKPASSILKLVGEEVIKKMKFSTYMKWSNYSFYFIRPIRWLVSLLDDKVIPFKILDLKANRYTNGHRFLGHNHIRLNTANDYKEKLFSNYVLVDSKKRKQVILSGLRKIAKKNGWILKIDYDLLEEVNNLVEFPTAFFGNFDKKYLNLPKIVLITSMKINQHFFHLENSKGELLPKFLSIRNGDNNHIENVIKGNERVLVARLDDAEFFFQQDQKYNINFFLNKIKSSIFHKKIGTISEHMHRVQIIAQKLSDLLGLNSNERDNLKRACEIYRFDLGTNMVDEFPELQGKMSGIYAKYFGENEIVSKALSEQYLPISTDGELPQTRIGALLSLSDKLDKLFSFFSVNIIPKGSNDPYGLRRSVTGIIKIIKKFDLVFSLKKLLSLIKKEGSFYAFNDSKFVDIYLSKKNFNVIMNFVLDRIKQLNDHVRYDILNCVTSDDNRGIIMLAFKRIEILNKHISDDDFKDILDSLVRVQNIATKVDVNKLPNPSLFKTNSEKVLYKKVNNLGGINLLFNNPDIFYDQLASLKDLINKYFKENMIMSKDLKIRNNRLIQVFILDKNISLLGKLKEIIKK